MELKTILLGQRPARVWTGGTGEAIVLLHGGWAGAEAYWSTVTDDLERTHFVVAPELPLVHSREGLPSFGACAAWLAELLTALGIERATLVGNSLGATVAWCFAGQYPERSAGLVLVNGYRPPVYSKMLRWLAGRTPIRALARGNLQRLHYGPEVLPLAFHDRAKIPAEVARTLENFTAADADRVLDFLLSGEEAVPPPKGSVLLIFGEADRSPVLDKNGARKMRLSLEQSKLVTIPDAGHLPQVERPAEFLRALRGYLKH
ncbi:alpha/beta hydrolase [uncultured Reyranella sp.]|uniref:alpha/beta fold hydrolase n=1 Tax=uncultured Reyranella sp. TaxID=735512 RepID=UPI0025E090CA|nr:alpha/beta hydrolase [uncultured Reyranella sp.]